MCLALGLFLSMFTLPSWCIDADCFRTPNAPMAVSTWSSSPSVEASLRPNSVWLDVEGTAVSFVLPYEGQAIFSYDLPASAEKNYSSTAHDFFTATQTTRARGSNNFVQVRLAAGLAPLAPRVA